MLVPANTFVASAIGVLRAGGTPVYVDVDERSYLMDLEAAADAVGSGVRFLLAVHLYGRLIDPDALRSFAAAHDLVLVEDAAQAHGARANTIPPTTRPPARVPRRRRRVDRARRGLELLPGQEPRRVRRRRRAHDLGHEVERAARAFRNYGSPRRYEHPEFGVNSRLDTVQAAVLEVKLAHMDAWNAARRRAAAAYHDRLADLERVTLPELVAGEAHVWHLFVVRVPDRDAVLDRLHADGVGAGIHYPTPVPLLGAVGAPGRPGEHPVAERVAGEILSLPLFPEITDAQIDRVCESLTRAVRPRGG